MHNLFAAFGLPRIRQWRYNKLFVILAYFFFGFFLHWYQPNMGGSGLRLPLNAITWMMICLSIALVVLWPFRCSVIRFSGASLWFGGGLAVLIVLSLLTKPMWRYEAMIVAAGIGGSLIFYLILLQIRLRKADIRLLFSAILSGVVLECLLSLVQFFHLPLALWWEFSLLPSARPYGVFQQINVLASFIATGVAIALWFCFVPHKAMTDHQPVKLSPAQVGLFFCLFFIFGLVLQLCQSQVGYLATLMVLLCYCCWFYRQKTRLLWVMAALVAGGLIGKEMQLLMHTPDIEHMRGTSIRWTFIVESLRMFSEKPLFGWGVGGFEYNFLHRFGGLLTHTRQGTTPHPHNEILLWMVDGGIVGLLGITAVIVGGVNLYRLAYRRKTLPLLVVVLPVLLHMMTEYPIYQSVPHWVLLLLGLRCVDIPCSRLRVLPGLLWWCRGIVGGGAISLLILLGGTYRLQGNLTQLERNGRQSELNAAVVPVGCIFLRNRYYYDRHMGDLLRFNQTGNLQYLANFESWARQYSEVHPDANVFDVRINIARHFDDKQREISLMQQAYWLFPDDPRFVPIADN